jgi:ABC-type branched-subunit amino acid transport system substrate-binding protein
MPVRSLVLSVLALVVISLSSRGALAQNDELLNEEAELVFAEGMDLFEQEFYGSALGRFERVSGDYPLHRKTTAAWLMAGKSLYRRGEHQKAIDLLSQFVREFPESRYVADAQRTRQFAIEQLNAEQRRGRLVQLGILLPTEAESLELTQAMFNGIRLAIDEHNSTGGGQMPVRMIFRDSGNRADIAADAAEELARERVDIIIGPLYSEEAEAAAGVAQLNGVPLIAPLATDEEVSRNRSFIFQANPTINMRGRLMARFAMRSLRLNEFGIVSDFATSYGEQMAEGFEAEVAELGGEVAFVQLLPGPSAWFRLLDYVKPDTLTFARALYLPISGSEAPTLIRAALNELGRVDIPIRVLGNKEWHGFNAPQLAAKFFTTYTTDFFVDETLAATRLFQERYRALSGEDAGHLAYAGYDVARYVLLQLTAHAGKPLHEAFHDAPAYQGLGLRFDFRNGNVNEAIYFMRYRDGYAELIR